MPHTNTEILLDSYYGIIKETGLFSPGLPKLPRKCESKHWLPCGADGQSFGRSVNGQVITKFSGMGTIYLLMALRRRAQELHYN